MFINFLVSPSRETLFLKLNKMGKWLRKTRFWQGAAISIVYGNRVGHCCGHPDVIR